MTAGTEEALGVGSRMRWAGGDTEKLPGEGRALEYQP